MRLLHLLLREMPKNFKTTMMMNMLVPISSMAFVAILSTAAQSTSTAGPSTRLMLLFIITVILMNISHKYTLVKASQGAEGLIHKLRTRLFDLVRRTDLITIEKIGHARLQGVLTQDTQVLSQILPILVIGLQQAITLVFLAAFLAWISPLACVLAFGLAGLAIIVHFARARGLRTLMQSADAAEGRVFNGLAELLRGFKEVRMSGARAEGVTRTVAEASQEARSNNVRLKRQWGRNYAVTEAMLYSLAGLIVFVVPHLAPDFYKVVMPATLVVLYISGPVCTVAYVTPMLTQAELALEQIETVEARLLAAAKDSRRETTGTLQTAPEAIELTQVTYSYRDDQGPPLFTVGPINAEFKAGEITFITGGNGSGKSTLLRLLTGLIPLDSGQLLVNHAALTTDQMQSYRDKISAIFADFHLSRRIYCINAPASEETIDRLLKRLELSDKVRVEDNTFSTVNLSTGQRKRLAYMVAELEDKPVVVLDEWAADQDPHFRRIFYETLLPELKDRGKIVICVTHDDRWFDMADRLYHMEEGRCSEVRDR